MRLSIPLLVVTGLTSTIIPAVAETNGSTRNLPYTYLTGGIVHATYKEENTENETVAGYRFNDIDISENGFIIGVGHRPHKNIAFQFDYMTGWEGKYQTGVPVIPELDVGIDGFGLSSLLILPAGSVEPYLRLGLARYESEVTYQGLSFGESDHRFLAGIGAEVLLGKQLLLRGEYTRFAENFSGFSLNLVFPLQPVGDGK